MNPSSRGPVSKVGAGPRLFCDHSGCGAAELIDYDVYASAGQTGEGDRVRAGAQPAVLYRGGVRFSGAGRDPELAGRATVSRLGGEDYAPADRAGLSVCAGAAAHHRPAGTADIDEIPPACGSL